MVHYYTSFLKDLYLKIHSHLIAKGESENYTIMFANQLVDQYLSFIISVVTIMEYSLNPRQTTIFILDSLLNEEFFSYERIEEIISIFDFYKSPFMDGEYLSFFSEDPKK